MTSHDPEPSGDLQEKRAGRSLAALTRGCDRPAGTVLKLEPRPRSNEGVSTFNGRQANPNGPVGSAPLRRRSLPSSPGAARNMAPGWSCTAGSSSSPSPCCTGSADCGSAGKSATTSTKPSSALPAHHLLASTGQPATLLGVLRRVMWIDRGLIGSPWMSKTVGRDPDAADREPGLPGPVRFSERGPGGQATLRGSPGEHKAGKTRARRRSDGKGRERSGRGGDLVNEQDEDRRIRSRRSVPADGRRYGRMARAAGEPARQAPGDRAGAQRHQGGYEEGGSGKRDGGLADPSP